MVQAGLLDTLRRDLAAQGKDVHVVAINAANGLDDQRLLVDACTYPLLQDTEEVGAIGLMDGKKDDFYIYDSDGKLSVYLSAGGDVSTDLSTDEGRAALLSAILAAE